MNIVAGQSLLTRPLSEVEAPASQFKLVISLICCDKQSILR